MSLDHSGLHGLIDMLEDGRAFYDEAAQLAPEPSRARFCEKTRHYAAMLADIRAWLAHGPDAGDNEKYAALLDGIYASLREEQTPAQEGVADMAPASIAEPLFADET